MSESVLVVDGGGGHASPSSRPITQVAVGILIDPSGRFLLTSRPVGKAYAGYWEFPGGKLEVGESVEQALRRELQEEIGVTVTRTQLWKSAMVDYPHALVRLHFCKVHGWAGDLQMHEGQLFSWQRLPVVCAPVLPGTVPVLQWLQEEAATVGSNQ